MKLQLHKTGQILAFFAFFLVFSSSSTLAQQVSFLGKNYAVKAPCEGNNFSIGSTDGAVMVVIVNAPASGTANVNDDFFTKGCAECLLIQITASDGAEYQGRSGTITHDGKKISFKVKVSKPDDAANQTDLTGEVVCTD